VALLTLYRTLHREIWRRGGCSAAGLHAAQAASFLNRGRFMEFFSTRVLASLLLSAGLSACTVFLGETGERAAKFDDWELCSKLAKHTLKSKAEWTWALADEIKKRGLDQSPKCRSAYDSTMKSLRLNVVPPTFEEALAGQPAKP
jgi:hypothetical protein